MTPAIPCPQVSHRASATAYMSLGTLTCNSFLPCFATRPNPSRFKILGLPGNPVATAAGLRFFVQPLLSTLTYQQPEQHLYAKVKTPLSRKAELRLFLKAKIEASPDGFLSVSFLDGQESYKTAPFLSMNGWAVIPEHCQTVAVNDVIEVLYLP